MKSFEKGEVLTADRLNELLAATAGTADMAGRTVPPRPGIKAQPGLARFNVQAEDACTGQVGALPDYAGLVKGVKYEAIEEPYIERGVIHLPASSGGGGCNCGPAFYDREDGSCIGLIRSVDYTYESNVRSPRIDDGNIRLPMCSMEGECPGVVGGIAVVRYDYRTEPTIQSGTIWLPKGPEGLMTKDGPMSWSDLRCAGVVRLHDGDATTLGVSAEVVGGFLNIYVDRQ